MRGAQSAGLVTYNAKARGHVGSRHRVVNGKRTTLSDLLLSKCRAMLNASAIAAPRSLPVSNDQINDIAPHR